jgi:hypothetical protein
VRRGEHVVGQRSREQQDRAQFALRVENIHCAGVLIGDALLAWLNADAERVHEAPRTSAGFPLARRQTAGSALNDAPSLDMTNGVSKLGSRVSVTRANERPDCVIRFCSLANKAFAIGHASAQREATNVTATKRCGSAASENVLPR